MIAAKALVAADFSTIPPLEKFFAPMQPPEQKRLGGRG